ncbi:MAG: hypothetical protein KDJ52_07695 [Anaerolineae bacterium]|nr:hypothetical protein [Anaerolineae bacterium]
MFKRIVAVFLTLKLLIPMVDPILPDGVADISVPTPALAGESAGSGG